MKAMKLKALQVGLWYVWLSGFILIATSFYATHMLSSSLKDQIRNPIVNRNSYSHMDSPKITIFTAPAPFTGSVGDRQSLAVRSWLALSSQIAVVLFSQNPSVVSFARAYEPRVLVDPNIDFTFLGTPFFHAMVAKCQAYMPDIAVLIDPETILLPDLISSLNYAYKLDGDWLLVASSLNVSHFPFDLDKRGNRWHHANGKRVKIREMQEMINRSRRSSACKGRMLMAWNNLDVPLQCGVVPPFLYQKGIHDQWVINEAFSCKLRFVFDASWTIPSFFLSNADDEPRGDNASVIEKRSWESVGNSHLGRLYGSLFFHNISYSGLPKILKCDKQYLFVTTMESSSYSFIHERMMNSWKERAIGSWRKKKMACINRTILRSLSLDCFMKDQQKKTLPPLDFPFALESLLALVADKNRTVILAVAGYSYKDMLMNWICRLRHLAVTNFLVCALDEEAYQFSILQGLPVFTDPSAPSDISFNDCHFGTECFQRVTKVKSRTVLKILKLGYNVLLSDVDVHWLRNPLPLLQSFGPAVLAAQSDEYNKTGPINLPRRLNSGFYFARSDGPTIASIEKVVKHAANSGLSEQPSFYDTLCGENGSQRVGDDRCLEPETNLTVQFLDRDLFPNGAYLDLWQKKDVGAECVKKGCFVLHNNWISGRLKKLERQVRSGLWEYNTGTRMCFQR